MKKGVAYVLVALLLCSPAFPTALSELNKSKSTNPTGDVTFTWKTFDESEIEAESYDTESLQSVTSLAELIPVEIEVMPLVFIADQKFERFVRQYINKPSGVLTIADMQALKAITELTIISDRSHLDLSCLSYLENLTSLTIESVYRADIDMTPLKELSNLTHLVLHTPYAESISAIGELKNLTHLDLSGCCDISDISFLRNLTELVYLDLHSNSIKDISAIGKLTKLEYLDLDSDFANYYNAAAARKDFTQGATGERENFTHTIKDVSPLRNLVDLRELHLYGNQVTDISPLKGLVHLAVLDLGNNNVEDISALGGLMQLTSLNLSNKFTAQIQFDLWGNVKNRNKVVDLSPLASLENLAMLNLTNCETVDDLIPLATLANLQLFPEGLIIPGSDQYTIGEVTITSIMPVSLREEEHIGSEAIGKAQPGESFKCVGISDSGWYMIELQDGQIAYVSDTMAEFREKAAGG